MKISVIIPTRGRAVKLNALLAKLAEADCEAVVVYDTDDGPTKNLMYQIIPFSPSYWIKAVSCDGLNASQKWNKGAKNATGDVLVLFADDVSFVTPDWDSKLLKIIANGSQYVGFNNGYEHWCPAHFAATREWLRRCNGGVLSIPHYRSQCMDSETFRRSQIYGGGVWTDEIVIQHDHPYVVGAPVDETYQRGWAFAKEDNELYVERERLGFPNNFEGFL